MSSRVFDMQGDSKETPEMMNPCSKLENHNSMEAGRPMELPFPKSVDRKETNPGEVLLGRWHERINKVGWTEREECPQRGSAYEQRCRENDYFLFGASEDIN